MMINLKLFYEYVNMHEQYLCLPGIDREDYIVVLSCFILCLCCDGTTT